MSCNDIPVPKIVLTEDKVYNFLIPSYIMSDLTNNICIKKHCQTLNLCYETRCVPHFQPTIIYSCLGIVEKILISKTRTLVARVRPIPVSGIA